VLTLFETPYVITYFTKQGLVERYKPTPVLELIKENLEDTGARHLMIISSGDAVVNILVECVVESYVQTTVLPPPHLF
jgi:hypothetical protein